MTISVTKSQFSDLKDQITGRLKMRHKAMNSKCMELYSLKKVQLFKYIILISSNLIIDYALVNRLQQNRKNVMTICWVLTA